MELHWRDGLVASPLGFVIVPAFLLLSGPTPLLPAAKARGRRPRGGWAFVIAGVLAGIGQS